MKTLNVCLAILLAGLFQTAPAQDTPNPHWRHRSWAGNRSAMNSATTLRQDMRKLWSDHVFWTRDYVIAAVGNRPDAKAAAARLMKNQEDIGNAIAKYYGPEAGSQLTSLLKQHIQIAVDMIDAASNENPTRFAELDRQWDRNGEEIVDFLARANPKWQRSTLSEMMKTHLTTTRAEVTARLNADWAADVKAFDAAYDHILKMADVLSIGIIRQFPEKFSRRPPQGWRRPQPQSPQPQSTQPES
jgi:hypothetical protein